MAAEKFQYLRSLIGTGAPTLMNVTLASSQSVLKGDLIATDTTNGLAVKASAAESKVIGIATHALATAADGTGELEVVALNANSVIKGVRDGSTNATTAMCWGKALYDIKATTQKIDFTDTTGGFVIPIKPTAADGSQECVISAGKLWNA